LKVFQTGVKTKAVLGVEYRMGRLLPQRGSGVSPPPPENLAFCVQNGAFGDKIALCFAHKQTAILTKTLGHKWFSEVE